MTADLHPGRLALEDALAAVEQAADEGWKRACRLTLDALIRHGLPFTTDDVWARLDHVHTREPRALGAMIRAEARAGRIVKSGRYVKSDRPECHRRDIPVWHVRQGVTS